VEKKELVDLRERASEKRELRCGVGGGGGRVQHNHQKEDKGTEFRQNATLH